MVLESRKHVAHMPNLTYYFFVCPFCPQNQRAFLIIGPRTLALDYVAPNSVAGLGVWSTQIRFCIFGQFSPVWTNQERPHHRLYMASRVQPIMEPQREIIDSNQTTQTFLPERSGSDTVPITEIGWIHPPRPCTVACLQTIFVLPVHRKCQNWS